MPTKGDPISLACEDCGKSDVVLLTPQQFGPLKLFCRTCGWSKRIPVWEKVKL